MHFLSCCQALAPVMARALLAAASRFSAACALCSLASERSPSNVWKYKHSLTWVLCCDHKYIQIALDRGSTEAVILIA